MRFPLPPLPLELLRDKVERKLLDFFFLLYLEYDYNDNAQVRGGVFLLPIGHLNESHEPPVFYGVQRPGVESIIIPSTWWEMGVGGSYQWDNGFSADLAMHSGLDIPTTGSSFGRIRSGRQKASRANFSSHAYTGRLKYSGVQGLALSASFNHQTDASLDDADNSIIEDATLYALTAAYNRGPFGIRGLYAAWDIDGTIKDTAGSPDDQFGWYIEPSFKPLDLGPRSRSRTQDSRYPGPSRDSRYSGTYQSPLARRSKGSADFNG